MYFRTVRRCVAKEFSSVAILVADSEEKIQAILDRVVVECEQMRLTLNRKRRNT